MHKKIPKICTGCRVSEAKIYLYHSTEISIARPHSEEWQTDTYIQKQWSMTQYIDKILYLSLEKLINHIAIFLISSRVLVFKRLKSLGFENSEKIN